MTASIPAKEALQLIKKIQKKLNLTHWRIDVSSVEPKASALFEVVAYRDRNYASVRISQAGWKNVERERLLKHELLHLVFDPIREEHDFQTAALDPERKAEYSSRLLRHIERAVEHLSYVV